MAALTFSFEQVKTSKPDSTGYGAARIPSRLALVWAGFGSEGSVVQEIVLESHQRVTYAPLKTTCLPFITFNPRRQAIIDPRRMFAGRSSDRG